MLHDVLASIVTVHWGVYLLAQLPGQRALRGAPAIYAAARLGAALGSLALTPLVTFGVVPWGMFLAGFFMAAIYAINLRRDLTPTDRDRSTLGERLLGLLRIWPFGFLVFSVLGTMYLGLATATEAAALGVVASIVIGFAWGDLTLAKLWRAFFAATRSMIARSSTSSASRVSSIASSATVRSTPFLRSSARIRKRDWPLASMRPRASWRAKAASSR